MTALIVLGVIVLGLILGGAIGLLAWFSQDEEE